MLGILYLLLIFLTGRELAGGMAKERPWLALPVFFGTGALFVGWCTYGLAFLAGAYVEAENPLFYGNLMVMAGLGIWLGILYWRRAAGQASGRNGNAALEEGTFKAGGSALGFVRGLAKRLAAQPGFKGELTFFFIVTAFVSWTMFYVFHVTDGVLRSGFTVYGDYAPHTAMIRSFSWGENFPTQYPHFGGEDVKYHFMFQFLAGNLEYLGLRIDIAYNLISILSLVGFLMVLYMLAVRITGKRAAGMVGILFFFFRSGLAVFRFFFEHMLAGDLWTTLRENTAFIGYTPNENWGLWNYNVYLNQRHLAFGLLIISIALWIYLDWLEAGVSHKEKGLVWLGDRLFTKEAWRSRDISTALLAGLMLGACAFWNGAALIGGLLILAGFGLFSDGKADYAVTAAVALLLSVLQSKIFIWGEAMSPSFYWGFLAEDKSLSGVLWYILMMSGIFFLGVVILAVFLKRRERAVLFCFFLPAVFAFFVSLTPDINVNHKYVMTAYAFLTMFWAWAVVSLFKRGLLRRLAAALLAVCLTVTGIYDFVVILKNNDAGHRVGVVLDSSLTRWISDSLDKDDLMLTPQYSMNEVTMSGEMMYCGWPYYAWSAGYDTNGRAAAAVEIYTTADAIRLYGLVRQEGITYIIFEEGMTFEGQSCREDVIAQTYPLVYTSEDGRIRIYET